MTVPDCSSHAAAIARIRAVLSAERAERDLSRYLSGYEGAQFDRLADRQTPDEFTDRDFSAVQALNVNVLHTARAWLRGEGKAQVSELLRPIPADVDIWDVQPAGYAAMLGPDSYAWRMWRILSDQQEGARRAGRGVTAGKPLHAKRPRLIPIFDHVGIGHALKIRHEEVWQAMWCALRQPDIRQRLTDLRAAAAAEDLSLLRTLDNVAWMSPRNEIAFTVRGWPPKKAEAKSLLAADHPHESLVRNLLTAARQAMELSGWETCRSEVALELVIHCPGRPAGDATNFLGGVADVLQDKTRTRNISPDQPGRTPRRRALR
jgi:hypothetical protein